MTGQEGMIAPDWLDVSRETLKQLDLFAGLVQKWNPVINLVSKRSMPDLWERHVFDSAQIFSLIPPTARHLVDLGSGGGFPGVVLAVLAKESLPDLHVTLVEVDRRKAVFLSEAVRQLSLRSSVITERIEVLPPLQADVVTVRALAPLTQLCGYAHRHMVSGGVALFAKGEHLQDELIEAERKWVFSLDRISSRSDPTATILAVRGIHHA